MDEEPTINEIIEQLEYDINRYEGIHEWSVKCYKAAVEIIKDTV